jgi:hypothetical protein
MTTTQSEPTVAARPGLLRRLQLSEPVRLWLYGIAAAVVALMVYVGYMTEDLAPFVVALVAAVLSVPAAESLRDQVWSQQSVTREIIDAANAARNAR